MGYKDALGPFFVVSVSFDFVRCPVLGLRAL